MSTEESMRSQTKAQIGELVVAEYTTLRDEIVKRIEIQHQLISLALIAPGTVLAIGFQTSSASLMLVYPLLGMFLSAVWLSNSFAIYDIAAYLRSHIQPDMGEDHSIWEQFRATIDTKHSTLLHFWGTRGLFMGTQLLVLLAGITLAKFDTAQILFLLVGALSSLLTVIVLAVPQRKTHLVKAPYTHLGRRGWRKRRSAKGLEKLTS